MYSERSAELKSDFYTRYGEAAGRLYFERVGLPCVLMESPENMLAFALDCGVRAYGRATGDVLRIIDTATNECHVSFAPGGTGAQIIYRRDADGVRGMKETEEYTLRKLLCAMRGSRTGGTPALAELCDRYGAGGWCAWAEGSAVRQVPLPLAHINALLLRTGQKRRARGEEARFFSGEAERIRAAAAGLRQCRVEVLFEMLNESEKAYERLFEVSERELCAVGAAMQTDGVLAARISRAGVLCFTRADMTDNAVHAISAEYERAFGTAAGVLVVK